MADETKNELTLYHILVRHKSFYNDILQLIQDNGGIVTHDWNGLPLLCSAHISDEFASHLLNDPRIIQCRKPQQVKHHAQYSVDLSINSGQWGLDRIDQRTTNMNQRYSVTQDGELPGGNRVNVFIMDTGIQRNHILVQNNIAAGGFDCFRQPSDPLFTWPEATTIIQYDSGGNPYETVDDHGTHVASIVAQVAPHTLIWPVRVFGGRDGSFTSDTKLLEAISWIVNAHNDIMLTGGNPSVVNMSFGAAIRPDAIDDYMIRALIDNGLIVCVSAGNDYSDAYYHTPSGVGVERVVVETTTGHYRIENVPADDEIDYYHKPIVVGACSEPVSRVDHIWQWSTTAGTNWGDAVDIFVPGERILGATFPRTSVRIADPLRPGNYYYTINFSNNANQVRKTGTSMASPIMVGICAIWLGVEPTLTQLQIRSKINERSTKGVFPPNELQHSRLDYFDILPQFIDNPYVYSPNIIGYTWYVPTTLSWDASEHSYTVYSDSNTVEWIEATSINQYGEFEPVQYYLDPASSLPTWIILTERVDLVGTGITRKSLGISITTQAFDYVGEFYVWATDGRSAPVRTKITVTVILTHGKPKWNNPPPGNLMGYAVNGDDNLLYTGDTVNITMSSQQEDDNTDGITTYEMIPSVDALPLGINWDGQTISGTAGIYNRNVPELYNFSVKAINDWGLTTIRQFYLKVQIINAPPEFDSDWVSSYPSRMVGGSVVYELGSYAMGEIINIQFRVINTDSDPLTWNIGPTGISNIHLTPDFISDGVIPLNARMNEYGFLSGVVSTQISAGDFYFRAAVCDDTFCAYQNFVIQITDETIIEPAPSDQIDWITLAGDLGDTYETYYSHFGVLATNPSGREITYEIDTTQSNLPTGITIDTKRGYILGLMPYVPSNTQYTFVVKAILGSNVVSRQFWFTVRNLFTVPAVINVHAHLFGSERVDLQHWLWTLRNIPQDTIYRHGDENFGRQKNPKMYVVGGLNLVFNENVVNALKDYHHPLQLQLLDLNWARAEDPVGNHVYDILYFDVRDNMSKGGGFVTDSLTGEIFEEDVIYPHRVLPSGNNLIFPASISNVRNDLILTTGRSQRTRPVWETNTQPSTNIGLNDNEALPFWMRTSQAPNTNPPGFKAVVPVAYLQPGKGLVVKEALRLAGINNRFNGRVFYVDRWHIESVGSLLTTFDNGTTIFDNNTTVFDNIPAIVGKHYKFPPGDKVIK